MEYSFCGILWRMKWDIEYTDNFGKWWATLTEDEQISYEKNVPIADRLYDEHLEPLQREGLL
jgi:hypothetical protein